MEVSFREVVRVFLLLGISLFPAVLQSADSYTVPSGGTLTINEHGVCRRVTNPHASQSIWVPTKASAEWSSFVANPGIGTVANCLNCNLPWSGSITHGSTATAYSSALPAGPCSGVSEIRTCNDGALSGSFTNQSCTNGCTGTPWGNVASGTSNTAYSSAAPSGVACATVAETRTCTNGTLSGSFTITSCNSGCAAGTTSNCDYTANAHSGSSGTCAGGYTGACSYSCSNGARNLVSNSCAVVASCPTNYVLVPALSPYTAQDFCVAKYEMKNVGGVATSQAAGTPWVSIPRGALPTTAGGAWKACRDLGTGYDLISNAQWQTIARNIEGIAANWSGGGVGSGSLNRGHSDNSPSSPQAADPSDANACFSTGQTCSNTTWHLQRRTNVISNGNVIWDLGGNVYEWTKDDYGSLGVNPAISGVWQEHSGLSATNLALFSSSVGSRNSTQGIGQIIGGSAGALLRGNSYGGTLRSGVFAAYLFTAASPGGSSFGFRCVFVP